VEVTVEEKFGGQLDTQHAQVFQFSLCSSNRNEVRIQFLETGTTLSHHAHTSTTLSCSWKRTMLV